MAIPDYQTIMRPLLQFAADNQEHSLREAIEVLATEFGLSESERKELLPSGSRFMFDNRVGWARTYLKKAVLLSPTRRSHFQITQRGLETLKVAPPRITNKYLEKFPEFLDFKAKRNSNDISSANSDTLIISAQKEQEERTPEESIEVAYQQIRSDLSADLIQQIMTCSPSFFERMVVDLLVKMGYGGSRKDAGQAVGKSGDGGIDGIIKEDRLGLDAIYIQAKRWEGVVGRPEIQKFVGALSGHRAKKGIFITTSKFTIEALKYVENIESKVVLLDGETLTNLMMDHNIGVSPDRSYEIKRIDSDYFTDS